MTRGDRSVPFARLRRTGEMVGPGQVERGLACDCVCPWCDTPLVARHGAEMRWHFAHHLTADTATRAVCRFGFWPSVRAMAVQALVLADHLVLPAIEARVHALTVDGSPIDEHHVYREAREIGPSALERDVSVDGYTWDLAFVSGDYRLLVTLHHPERTLPPTLPLAARASTCALLIDLAPLALAYGEVDGEDFLAELESCVLDDLSTRRWLAHRNVEESYVEAHARLHARSPGWRPLERPAETAEAHVAGDRAARE